MKCPLQFTLAYSDKGMLTTPDRGCLKEECAWWFKENNCCSILTLAQGSIYLHKVLLDMSKNIYVKASIAR